MSTMSTGPQTPMTLQRFPEKLAVVSLAAGADIPTWAESSSIFSITATATETAVVCAGRSVPTKVRGTRGLTAFVLAGPGASDQAGVLVELLAPLAEAGITAFTTTTHATIWVLVPEPQADRAGEVWAERGHTVEIADPDQPGGSL